jgi:hypothetical protein
VSAPTVSSSVANPTSLIKVKTVSGFEIEVMGRSEAKYYRDQMTKYLAENKFSAVTDLADLDRLLFLELMIFRWTGWLSSGKDYDGYLAPSQEDQVRKNIKEVGPQISTIKQDLGLTKSQRDKEAFESVGQYLVDLKARAKEHGVRREKQLTTAICLVKELFSLIGTYDRSNELERSKIGLETPEDILDWIRMHMKPEFDAVDEYFQQHQQKFWVRKV